MEPLSLVIEGLSPSDQKLVTAIVNILGDDGSSQELENKLLKVAGVFEHKADSTRIIREIEEGL
jgi:hypothetical protein